MKPVLIITRPEPDGARFAATMQEGIDVKVILSPLIEIVPLDAKCQADEVIFTSANGVAQAARLGLTSGRAWCVGDRTAEMARKAGFDAVSAQGNAEDLVALILEAAPKGALAHIRGTEARGDLGPRLRAEGINCVDVVAYDQVPTTLSDDALNAIRGVAPVIIPLFSPRSAGLLLEQVTIGPHVTVVAMSKAVANRLGSVGAHVIAEPTAKAMHDALIAILTGRLRVL